MGYAAFVLDEPSRKRLLNVYKPKHQRVIAHHVTLQFGIAKEQFPAVKEFFDNATTCQVRGYADLNGVDCVAVIVAGWHAQAGTPGTPLHVTISVADGIKPVMAKYPAEQVMEVNGYMVLSGSIQFLN